MPLLTSTSERSECREMIALPQPISGPSSSGTSLSKFRENRGRGFAGVFREKLAGGGRASQSKNATCLSRPAPRVAGSAQNSNLAFWSCAVSLWLEMVSG